MSLGLFDEMRRRMTHFRRSEQKVARFVLRNHLGEITIRAAKAGDFTAVRQLLAVLQTPFAPHAEHAEWAGFPPDWASSIEISCSS